MKEIIVILILIFGFEFNVKGETDNKFLYQKVFEEQLQMLNGLKPIDFKKSVFLTENAYHNEQLNYETYCREISTIGQKLKTLIKLRGLESYKTVGNWAVFTYMNDSISENNFKPYTYDFEDFMGDKDWKNMFVTKLMDSKSGNCHSLPYFYKILCDEIGAKASLALAPNHIYIKHIDEKGQWVNVELTNGGFPTDQWIIKQMTITVEAIKSEAYMTPLIQKEEIAMTMFDLAMTYGIQYGNDNFVMTVCDTALHYFPKCIPLLMTKANCIRDIIETEKKKQYPNPDYIYNNIALYTKVVNSIDELGYKNMPIELYNEWVKSVEDEITKHVLRRQ